MDDRSTALMFVLVLCVCGALLYLDWRRQGEIELLHDRVDELSRVQIPHVPAAHGKSRIGSRGDAAQASAATSLVDRILHATDDRTFADIAKEGA